MKRILIISHKSPYAPLDGGVLAIRNFFEALNRHSEFEVYMFCVETQKHKHTIPSNHFCKDNCESHFIDTGLKPVDALKHLLNGKSYNLSRFYSKALSLKIQEHLKKHTYDFVLFESLFSTVYYKDIKPLFSGKILYRSHNVEYKIWEKLADHEGNPLKKWYLKTLTSALKRYEVDIHHKMDAIFSISKDDLKFYKSNTTIPVYLLFFIRSQMERTLPLKEQAFFHLGSMDWQPNLEAVDWFVNQVWKQVYKENNSLKLYLGGKAMPEKYFNMEDSGIVAFDYVEQGDDFMQKYGTLVVPLFTGSGIRIKVVDALSIQVPILSTDIGISGIGIEENKHFLKANSAKDFQDQILRIGKKEVDLEGIVKKSGIFAKENFEEHTVLNRFFHQLNQI